MRSIAGLLGLVVAVSVLVAGCSGGTNPAERAGGVLPGAAPPTAKYWPLKVGNSWDYRATYYKAATAAPGDALLFKALGATAGIVPSPGTYTGDHKVVGSRSILVAGTTDIDGVAWFCLHWVDAWPDVSGIRFTYDLHDQHGFCEKWGPTPEPGWYWLKIPLKVGATWRIRSPDGANKGRIMSLTAQTTVPAGTFKNCLLVRQTWSDGSLGLVWYAPGKGEVKAERRDGGLLTYQWELIGSSVGG